MVRGFTFEGELLEAAFQILETFLITLSPYLPLRGQGRAQRGRGPLHKIRVCLILGTAFYKQILPKYDVILIFSYNIENTESQDMLSGSRYPGLQAQGVSKTLDLHGD